MKPLPYIDRQSSSDDSFASGLEDLLSNGTELLVQVTTNQLFMKLGSQHYPLPKQFYWSQFRCHKLHNHAPNSGVIAAGDFVSISTIRS